MKSNGAPFRTEAAPAAPSGRTGSAELMLALEVELPWTGPMWQSPDIPADVQALRRQALQRGIGLEIICLVPDDEYSVPTLRRVMLLKKKAGGPAEFRRAEYLLPHREIAGLLQCCLEETGGLAAYEQFRKEPDGVRDLMVCTQGSDDIASVRFGQPIYELLRTRHAPASLGRLRVWRATHLWGDGGTTALLESLASDQIADPDPQDLQMLVLRRGPVSLLRLAYGERDGQALPCESALPRQTGWRPVQPGELCQSLGPAADCSVTGIRVELEGPCGRLRGAYDAMVEVACPLLAPGGSTCGYQEVQTYRVTHLARHPVPDRLT